MNAEERMQLRDIGQLTVAVLTTIGVFTLVLLGFDVPEAVWFGWIAVVSFFFGGATTANGRDSSTSLIRLLRE